MSIGKKVCYVKLLYDGKTPEQCRNKGCNGEEETAKRLRFVCFQPVLESTLKALMRAEETKDMTAHIFDVEAKKK